MMNRDLCYLLNNTIDQVAERFIEKYFNDRQIPADFYFVEDHLSNEMNYTLYVNDYYFDMQDIYYALWYDIPFDILDERYEHQLDADMKWVSCANLKNFYLSKKEK